MCPVHGHEVLEHLKRVLSTRAGCVASQALLKIWTEVLMGCGCDLQDCLYCSN